jgi:DNA-directed RNA polymerase subunit L
MQIFLNNTRLLINMEISVVESKKGKLVFETVDMGHTLLNVLKSELWNDSHVKIATYAIKHSQIGKPKFILETDGVESPKAALAGAVSRLKKTSDKFRKDLSAIK